MTIEERLIDRDVLLSTNALVLKIQLLNPIHQQEGVTVGQVFFDFVDIHVSLALLKRIKAPRTGRHSGV